MKSDDTDSTDGFLERLKRRVLCGWLGQHYGYIDVDHEEGTLYFQCVRCEEKVDEHRAEYSDLP